MDYLLFCSESRFSSAPPNWRATFDWLIDIDHSVKVLEGAYWDKGKTGHAKTSTQEAGDGPSYGIDEYVKLALQKLNGPPQ